MPQSIWDKNMKKATDHLSRACAIAAEDLAENTAGIRDIRELAAAMKDLTALHGALAPYYAALGEMVEVSFDTDGELWKR